MRRPATAIVGDNLPTALSDRAGPPARIGRRYRGRLAHKLFEHDLLQQVRRQQPLCQDEVVKGLGVEPAAHGFFHLVAQLAQARVAIEISVGLAGCPERIALDFLVGHGVGEHDVVLEHAPGPARG